MVYKYYIYHKYLQKDGKGGGGWGGYIVQLTFIIYHNYILNLNLCNYRLTHKQLISKSRTRNNTRTMRGKEK